jgi:predicted GNAT superfamily acetyltransferase
MVAARDDSGGLVGFKLGCRQGGMLFYSWLGGVHPEARRRGLAQRLMAAQQRWARSKGHAQIETPTRAANRTMTITNLKGRFCVPTSRSIAPGTRS